MKKIFTGIAAISFLIYIFVIFNLLFMGFRYSGAGFININSFALNSNIIPFRTILSYVSVILNTNMNNGIAIRNLIGNLFLLFPLGFYLPFFIRKMGNVKIYILSVSVLIIVIEVMQFITGRGILDIDDFILNFAGAMIGFVIFFVFKKMLTKRENIRSN